MSAPVRAIRRVRFLKHLPRGGGIPLLQLQFTERQEGTLVRRINQQGGFESLPRRIQVAFEVLQHSKKIVHVGITRRHLRGLVEMFPGLPELVPPQLLKSLSNLSLQAR